MNLVLKPWRVLGLELPTLCSHYLVFKELSETESSIKKRGASNKRGENWWSPCWMLLCKMFVREAETRLSQASLP